MKNIKIAGKNIGEGQWCFIIAEAGINHNGDIGTAKKMIDAAKRCGVDAIKFQTFKTEEFVSDKKQQYSYESSGKKVTEPMFAMFKRYEFGKKEFTELAKYCRKKKIIFFSTPQNPADLDLLMKIKVPAIKVGSDDLTNLPLMKDYAKRGLPVIISTGMSYLSEVASAVETIQKYNRRIAILHCISSYPAESSEVNLKRLGTLKLAFPDYVIGYSDHTNGTAVSVAAVALGAKIIEKHFTLDRKMKGPDHRFSADPREMEQLVKDIRDAERTLGTSDIKPSKKEMSMRDLCRRSIVASRSIRKGSVILKSDIAFKRPGDGILPGDVGFIVGRRAKRDISSDSKILIGDIL